MKAVKNIELQCVCCGKHLDFNFNSTDNIVCLNCKHEFPVVENRPVLLRADNELFPSANYAKGESVNSLEREGKKSRFKWIPGKSVNLVRLDVLGEVVESIRGSEHPPVILVIGAGNQANDLIGKFQDSASLVFCDIASNATVDIFCDAQELPFPDGGFDGVISTAVMEHVYLPEKVAEEITRVTKVGGFIYSEIPFLQNVHEGAYDFTRFTLSGHRRLFDHYEEEKSGMVAGPGTALAWSLDHLSQCFFRNRKLSKALRIATRYCFFWVKYLDKLIKNHPVAVDGASATFFYGHRIAERHTASEIVKKYHEGK